ncbi:MAG: hypothetical protein QXX19_08355 [Candidatus Caldarchaeum sp.]
MQKVEKLLRKLREKPKFQEFEQKLAQKGKRVGKIRALFDETNKVAILGIANEGDEEKIAHQVRIKIKADKEDEPEEDAEPAIQATACGQATGEAVPEGAKMHAQMYDAGEGGDVSPSGSYNEGYNYEGPEICVSQWGYSYICNRFTPLLQVGDTGPLLLATFIGGQARASFTIWNAGGRTLTGSATATGPFTILSGGSFSLAPGQPQKIVVGFTPSQAGRFLGEVRFTNSAIKVYLEGKAYTFEEYLQLLVEFYNQLANLSRNPLLPRRPAPPILYVPAAKSLAFGFDRLSTDIVEQMVEIADQLQGQPPSPQTTSSSSDSTASEIELALQELSLYLNDPNFPQHLERMKSQYPAFAVFLEVVTMWIGQEEISIARELVQLAQQDRFRRVLEILAQLGVVGKTGSKFCGFLGQTYPCSPLSRLAAFTGFVATMSAFYRDIGLTREAAHTILDNFYTAIEYIASPDGKGLAPGANAKNLLEQLLNAIPYLQMPGANEPPPALVRDFVSLAQLLGNMVVYGRVDGQPALWKFYAFGLDVGGGKKIEIIATIQLGAFRDSGNPNGTVTIFANTFDFYGQEAQDRQNIIDTVVAELSAAINYINEHGRDYLGRDIAVGFVRSQIDDSTADSIMNQVNARAPGAPVLLVYCVANCDSANPVYHFIYRGMTEQQAKALACALGFSDFCARSYEVVESSPPWDSKEEELCPMAMVGSDCPPNDPPADPPPMP